MRPTRDLIAGGLLLAGLAQPLGAQEVSVPGTAEDGPPPQRERVAPTLLPRVPTILPRLAVWEGPEPAERDPGSPGREGQDGGAGIPLPEVPALLGLFEVLGLGMDSGEEDAGEAQGPERPRSAAAPSGEPESAGDAAGQRTQASSPDRAAAPESDGGQEAASEAVPDKPVGENPGRREPQEIVIGFDQRSVLTPKGSLVVEPSLGYTSSSSTQVAIEGFTIIPSIAIGLINVSEVQRDTLTGAISLRYGLFHRLEVETRIPYVYKTEQVRERRVFKASPLDIVRESDGHGLGDVELSLRFQFNRGLEGWPFFIGNLRVKSDTGTDPFEVDRRVLTVEDDQGDPVRIGEVFEEQPTGTGFWAVEPSVTMIAPSDPAVFYSNLSYLWNIERKVNDEIGRVDPGDGVGLSFGMGVGVNEAISFSMGYDHTTIFATTRENDAGTEPQFDQLQVGSFQFGFSSPVANISLALGATEAAPDVQLEVRKAFRFF